MPSTATLTSRPQSATVRVRRFARASMLVAAGSLALAGCSGSGQASQPAETPKPTDNGSLFELAGLAASNGTVKVRVGSAAEVALPAVLVVDVSQATIRSGSSGGGSGAGGSAAPVASAPVAGSAAAGGTSVEISWSALTTTGRVAVDGPNSAVASLASDCVQSIEQASGTEFSGTIQCQARPNPRSTQVVPLAITFDFGGDATDG